MRKPLNLRVLMAILLFPFSLLAEQNRIVIQNQHFDFGVVEEGTLVTHNIKIKNNSAKKIRVELPEVDHCCIFLSRFKSILKPRDESEINLKLATQGKSGHISIEANFPVIFDDGLMDYFTTVMTGTIEPGILFRPKHLYLGRPHYNSLIEKSIILTTAADEIIVNALSSSLEKTKIEILKGRKPNILKINLKIQPQRTGYLEGEYIHIKTQSPEKEIYIPLHGYVELPVQGQS